MPVGLPCHRSFWLAEVWVKLQSSVPINCEGKSSGQLGATGSPFIMLERHELIPDHFPVLSRWEKAQSIAFSKEISSQIFSHFHSLSPFLVFIFSRWVRWIHDLGNYFNFSAGRNAAYGDLTLPQLGTWYRSYWWLSRNQGRRSPALTTLVMTCFAVQISMTRK